MVKLIQGKYRYASSSDMLAYLGVKKLPPEGIPEQLIQGVRVYVKPLPFQVTQTYCRHCNQDIEGFSPYPRGAWRDRGNNGTCDGKRQHSPAFWPKRNWQGLRVYAICECGQHVPVGRMHQHKCRVA